LFSVIQNPPMQPKNEQYERLRDIFISASLSMFNANNFPKFLENARQEVQIGGGMGFDQEKIESAGEALFQSIINDENNRDIRPLLERAKESFLRYFFLEVSALISMQNPNNEVPDLIFENEYQKSAERIAEDTIEDTRNIKPDLKIVRS